MDVETHQCPYCGTASAQAMNRPKPVNFEDLEQQMRHAQDMLHRLTPLPLRWLHYIVPIIGVLIFVFVLLSMFR
ncbi:MAG: hypothetical protein AB7K24_01565 [Gemmataceae bacterium]